MSLFDVFPSLSEFIMFELYLWLRDQQERNLSSILYSTEKPAQLHTEGSRTTSARERNASFVILF